jgi:hypothetical protein
VLKILSFRARYFVSRIVDCSLLIINGLLNN